MDLYLETFRKLWEYLGKLAVYPRSMDYKAPWSILAPSTRGNWVVLTPTQESKA
jgi:hypothetical protein